MLKLIKDYMMPFAMLTGAIFYKIFNELSFLTPYFIFFMLLFTFSKLSPKEIGYKKLHFILLFIQLSCAAIAYLAIRKYDNILAQGAMICFLAPTATSAAVITGMLNGSISFLTSFTLISNLGVALIAPVFFTLWGDTGTEINFMHSCATIFIKVFPLLILPLLCAWCIRYRLPKLQTVMLKYSKMPFYLWSLALIIVTARTTNSVVNLPKEQYGIAILLALASLIICCFQFIVGKTLGSKFDNRIASGQSLGQKNTILAIWMSQVFLNPIAALAPSTYIFWQNIINSYQLVKVNKRAKKEQV